MECGAFRIQHPFDRDNVGNRAREPVQLGAHEDIAIPAIVDGSFELSTLRIDARQLFLKYPLAARQVEITQLSLQACDLLDGGCSRVTDLHIAPQSATKIWDNMADMLTKCKNHLCGSQNETMLTLP
jgi:hypothetical protein